MWNPQVETIRLNGMKLLWKIAMDIDKFMVMMSLLVFSQLFFLLLKVAKRSFLIELSHLVLGENEQIDMLL